VTLIPDRDRPGQWRLRCDRCRALVRLRELRLPGGWWESKPGSRHRCADCEGTKRVTAPAPAGWGDGWATMGGRR
jgi:hypothetical protein